MSVCIREKVKYGTQCICNCVVSFPGLRVCGMECGRTHTEKTWERDQSSSPWQRDVIPVTSFKRYKDNPYHNIIYMNIYSHTTCIYMYTCIIIIYMYMHVHMHM